MKIHKYYRGPSVFLLSTVVTLLGPGPARAQWGIVDGLGWGFPGLWESPSPTNFLNQHALQRSGAGVQSHFSRSPYRNNPNSYFNRIRDNGFVPHYEVRRHQEPAYQPRPAASLDATPRVNSGASPAPEAPRPVLPLGSFFEASQRLVWPSDSPTGGDLKARRDVSDQAILAVLEETRNQAAASVTKVGEARQKLLDYGRPALKELRETSTSRIADTFHLFLLSLYDSLAQAASPPQGGSTAGP